MRLLKFKNIFLLFVGVLAVASSIFLLISSDVDLPSAKPEPSIVDAESSVESKETLIKRFSVKPITSSAMMEEVVVMKDGKVVEEK